MADQVQAALDQMVAPLKDLLDRGIFSEVSFLMDNPTKPQLSNPNITETYTSFDSCLQEEVRAIVTRRREYEYLLRRRAARKADFLRYIETEIALEKLRALRSRQALLKEKASMKDNKHEDDDARDKRMKQQKPIGDVHIVQHVHLLFVRAIRKFKGDVTLYLQHAAFCKQVKSFSRLTRIYAEAVQIHPKNVGLWIEAASNEFFGVVVEEEVAGGQKKTVVHGGGSVQNARIILQRGLRINPNSQDLWLQAFGLELHYIQKLRGRHAIMFADPQSNDESDPSKEQKHAATPSVSNTLPLLVFKNAIRAIPDDLTFRLKFVDLCQMFPKDCVEELHLHIMNTIRDNFKSEPFAWVAWAAHIAKTRMEDANQEEAVGFLVNADDSDARLDDNNCEPPLKRPRSSSVSSQKHDDGAFSNSSVGDSVIDVLREATETIPTAEMFLLSVRFSENYAASLVEDIPSEANTETRQELLTNLRPTITALNLFVQQLFERADRLGIQSAELVLEQVNYCLSTDREHPRESAIQLLDSFCKKRLAQAAGTTDASKLVPSTLWIRWAELHVMTDVEATSQQLKSVMFAKALDVLRMGLKNTPVTASSEYMILLLHLVTGLVMIIARQEGEPNDEENAAFDNELARLFQQMLILAPGQIDTKTIEQEVHYSDLFGPCSISQACLKYLRLQHERKGLQAARNVFHRVLYQHQLPPASWITHDVEGWKAFIDECIHIELGSKQDKQQKQEKKGKRQQLDRLYRLAMALFQETSFGDNYKQERENKLAMMV